MPFGRIVFYVFLKILITYNHISKHSKLDKIDNRTEKFVSSYKLP